MNYIDLIKMKLSKIFTNIKHFYKKKRNVDITILAVLSLLLSLKIMGLLKTIILIVFIGIIIFLIKNGGSLIMGKNNKNKKHHKIINILITLFMIGSILVIFLGFGFLGYIVYTAPKFDKQKLNYKEASTIYDNKGNEIIKIGQELRDKISFNEIPQVFIDAIVATEDSRFFEHNGLDLPRFLKASLGQATGNSGAGGASTITMQVVKNNFTSTDKKITRKFTDIYLSVFKMEKNFTKEQILEFYVNGIHLGVNNTLGIAETSRNLFGKEVKDINLSEAALLAGMFQSPYYYNPYKFPERAADRRNTVLYLMKRHGYINEEERKIASEVPIESLLASKDSSQHPYQAYIDYVINEVVEKTEFNPMIVPMNIYTNLNVDKQDYLNDVLSGEKFKFENDLVQAGIAVTDVNSGAIVALGNGRNRSGKKLFNLATDIKRQVGSTAKPVFDYGPGMEYNNWSTYTPFVDDVYKYSDGKELYNWDNKYFGLMTSRYALGQSRNIPALKAFQQVENKKIVEFVTSLGIKPEIAGGKIHEAHAIGGFNGSSPLAMAVAFAAFANGGYYIEPFAVNRIEFLDETDPITFQPEKKRVMSDSTAYMITDILRFAVDNKLLSGKVNGIQIAAKSGTSNFDEDTKKRYNLKSNAINDLWYVGYSPDYAIGMWYGYEKIDQKYYSTSPTSSGYRDKLFSTLAQGLFDKNGKKFTIPTSVVEVKIEKNTIPAMLPSPYTPENMITTELFKKGTEPTEISPRFNTLDNVKNLDIKTDNNDIKLTWDAVNIPNMLTNEYLETIKNQKEKYIDIYNNEDKALLGTLGYNVYLKNDDNSLELLGFTNETNYTHTPKTSGTLNYVVKTSYSIFKSSESDGSQISITSNQDVPIIEIYLNGNEEINIKAKETYTDAGVSVLEDMVNVKDKATIKITISKKDANNIYQTVSNIDTSQIGTYKIEYNITYKDNTAKLTRIINIS